MNLRPNSRSFDPVSSHDAGEEVTASGKRLSMALKIFKAMVAITEGLTSITSRELAHRSGYDRHEVARRMSDLESMGKIERGDYGVCTISKRKSITWVVK